MHRGMAVLAAGTLVSAPAAAETERWVQTEETMPARLIEVGTWEFSATKRGPDGRPECYESWTFNADGSGLIVSGKQRVTTSWKADRFQDLGQFLFVTNETTTDGPDCMGRAVDTSEYPYKSSGFQLIFFENGMRAKVCDGGKLMTLPDGTTTTMLDADDCWGEIAPLSKG